ncbi:heat shock protein 21 [Penaeus vannamei]|uniref:Heat shock protein 21 n=1 Tax=Penaeus vannamei TaxID=6689 RepID=A0A3R7QQP3_PENVA|nr:heat shock protein 21 [Penaeus vannamei]
MAPIQNSNACEVNAASSEVKCCRCGGSKDSWDMFLPITHRGSFFQDSFFSNIHQHFDAAVREVLDKWSGSDLRLTDRTEDTNVRHSDVLGRYRRLRSVDLKEENQAVTVTSDDTSHKESEDKQRTTIIPIKVEETNSQTNASKTTASQNTNKQETKCEHCNRDAVSKKESNKAFVLDVKDFSDGGEISVKAVSDRELVVEGRKEKQGDGSRCSQRFLRRFVVPGDIQLDGVTSVVSSDGVLTISAPKKQPKLQVKEVSVPITIEGKKTGPADTVMQNGDLKSNEAATGAVAKENKLQNATPVSSANSASSNVPFKASATRGPEETSSSNQKGDSQQHTTVIPVRVQGTEEISGKQTCSPSKPSTGVRDEDASARATSFAARGKGGDAEEGNQEDKDLYKLKGSGAKFPIKINGSVINTNSV